ncbi:MAG: FAD binding domain-containing protein [Acidobacteriota bacterium]
MESAPIRCLINDRDERIDPATVPSGLTVLDFIRNHLRAPGTKEGCKEGDCGACVVLVGELEPAGDRVRYWPVTSCMMPIAEAAGRHLVTVEGLDVGGPNMAQRLIVEEGASQCGFCTPGIVVSVMGRLVDGGSPPPTAGGDGPRSDALADDVDRALSGHLCRCTGYRSLRSATRRTFEALREHAGVDGLVSAGELPDSFLEVPGRLRDLRDAAATGGLDSAAAGPAPATPWVAGGTDLYVQRGETLPAAPVSSLHRVLAGRPEARGVRLDGESLRIGALTSFEELAQDPLLRARVPAIPQFMDLVASWQIRTRSTLGGNLINASPIGDVTILMLALGAVAVFEDLGGAGETRELPLEALYRGYKQLDRRPGEVLIEVRLPDLSASDRVHFEKTSKRRWLDIATVNSAVRVRLGDGVVEDARVAVGGVAPIPLFLPEASRALCGEPSLDRLQAALEAADAEIAPISDVRGSADYKRLLVRHQLAAHAATLLPALDADATYRAVATA